MAALLAARPLLSLLLAVLLQAAATSSQLHGTWDSGLRDAAAKANRRSGTGGIAGGGEGRPLPHWHRSMHQASDHVSVEQQMQAATKQHHILGLQAGQASVAAANAAAAGAPGSLQGAQPQEQAHQNQDHRASTQAGTTQDNQVQVQVQHVTLRQQAAHQPTQQQAQRALHQQRHVQQQAATHQQQQLQQNTHQPTTQQQQQQQQQGEAQAQQAVAQQQPQQQLSQAQQALNEQAKPGMQQQSIVQQQHETRAQQRHEAQALQVAQQQQQLPAHQQELASQQAVQVQQQAQQQSLVQQQQPPAQMQQAAVQHEQGQQSVVQQQQQQAGVQQPLLQQTVTQGGGATTAVQHAAEQVATPLPSRCPAPSRQLFATRAGANGTVMLSVMTADHWDFGLNWLHWVKKAGIDYYVVAAVDVATSERLAAIGDPCFEWFDDEAPKLGLAQGQEGWRRLTWARVFVLAAIIDYGFNLVVSDVDVVWFKDPRVLLAHHPSADLIFGLNHASTANSEGDDRLEKDFNLHTADFNTGVYIARYSKNVSDWVHAWAAYFEQCNKTEQACCHELIRTKEGVRLLPPPNERISTAWNGRIRVAAMPVSVFQTAHTRFLQQLHKVKGVEPYNVHATQTYNGLGGKRARLRDMGLWVDPPPYYAEPSFVTVDLDRAQVPASLASWKVNEDMLQLHLATLNRQLQQAYVGMALAVAASRPFILPKFQCFCDKAWNNTAGCRMFGAQEVPLPVVCPTDHLFQPDNFLDSPETLGTQLDVREPPFLENPATPEAVKTSVLVIVPSAAMQCNNCVKEQPGLDGTMILLVPPALTSTQLLALLDPYRMYRVWRLNFSGVGSLLRAYAGLSNRAAAEAFDRRISAITTTWCCRQEGDILRYHTEDEQEVQLTMTSEFDFSSTFVGRRSSRIAGAAAAAGTTAATATAVGGGAALTGALGGGAAGTGGAATIVQ